jgi:hypothetical protein
MKEKIIKNIFFFTLLAIFFIPIIEFGSFILLQLKQVISFKMNSKINNKFIPDEFTFMKLGEFPFIKTHTDYKDDNYSSYNGFRGGQSDATISINKYFYYEIKGEKNLTAFFGGSTTFGVGATDKGTFPEQYKKITKENVINLGLGGNNQEGEIVLLNYFLKQGYIFNKIIFLDGINQDDCFFSGRKSINNSIKNISAFNNSNYYTVQLFLEYLPNKISRVLNNNKNNREKKKGGGVVENLNVIGFEFCADQYIKNLIYLDSLSKSNSIKTYIILQPSLEIINSNRKNYEWKNYESFYNLIIKKYTQIEFLLTNTKLVDLRSASKEEYYVDSQHLNDDGNAFLATEFIKFIK